MSALYTRSIAAIATWCYRYGWFVLPVAVAAASFTTYFAAKELTLNTSTSDMLAEHLDFRRHSERLKKIFPLTRDVLVVVVSGESFTTSYKASRLLYRAMRERDDLFLNVFSAPHEPYFINNSLLFRDKDDIIDYSDALIEAQPFIATLSRDNNIKGIYRAIELIDLHAQEASFEEKERIYELKQDIATVVRDVHDGHKPPTINWRKSLGDDSIHEGTRFLIISSPQLDFSSLTPAKDAIDFITQEGMRIKKEEALEFEIGFSGNVALEEDEKASVIQGASVAGLLALVLVAFLVIRGLHSWRAALCVMLSLMLGLLLTTGYAAAAIGHLNLISTAFAVLFIGIGVDFGIQLCLRYLETSIENPKHTGEQRLHDSVISLERPLTLAAISAAGGFLAFVPTDYVGMSELGVIAGGGLAIAYIANLTLLPALLSIFCRKASFIAKLPPETTPETPIHRFIEHHPVALTSIGFLIMSVSLLVVPHYKTNFDPFYLYDPESLSVKTTLTLLEDRESQLYAAQILAKDEKEAQTIKDTLHALPEVSVAHTISDFLPNNIATKRPIIEETAFLLLPSLELIAHNDPLSSEQRRQTIKDWAELERAPQTGHPGLQQALDSIKDRHASVLLSIEEAILRGLPTQLELLRDSLQPTLIGKSSVSIQALPKSLRLFSLADDGFNIVTVLPSADVRHSPEELTRFVDAVRNEIPSATGPPVITVEGKREVLRAFVEAGTLAICFVLILLLLSLRAVVDSILAFLPLFMAATMTVAIAVAINLPLNFANIIALPLLFSLGVSYGIYLLSRERTAASVKAMMLSSTPRAILYSALTTVAGFGSLALSPHRGTASMGLMLLIALLSVLITSLIFLPALLQIRENYRKRKQNKRATSTP
ncbi:MAG: MMPL family transporter [Alphaproteobacteria bacterium GM7ARS4]|nr:MMPL family transporter [Alphaproteobacteria bacterium GM7ARS4]